MMAPPVSSAYLAAYQKLPVRSVELGCFGIALYPPEKLSEAQRGYNGDDWGETWLVVGRISSLGDPITVDLGETDLPVMTAMHGMGEWKPRLIAQTFEQFGRAMVIYSKIAQGRPHPVALENHPISEVELDEFIAAISQVVGPECADFWTGLVE